MLGTLGAASILGVPFMLALLGRDPIITTIGLSLIAALKGQAGIHVGTLRQRLAKYGPAVQKEAEALYALLDAPFLSGIQVLTYVGGVGGQTVTYVPLGNAYRTAAVDLREVRTHRRGVGGQILEHGEALMPDAHGGLLGDGGAVTRASEGTRSSQIGRAHV